MSDPEYILLSNSIRGAEKSIFIPNKRTFEKMLQNSSFLFWLFLAIFGHFRLILAFWTFSFTFTTYVRILGTLE